MKEHLKILLKGMAMGAADVVPGVSGGTIAFITGIYERLLAALSSIDLGALNLILKGKIREFWDKVDGNFLLALFIGILISIVSLAKGLTWLLENKPILIWSFFFGLIMSSSFFVGRSIPQWNGGIVISLIAGAAIAYFITTVSPAQGPEGLWYIFISGMIAICAMILPGISGSFILLLLGSYSMVLGAVGGLAEDPVNALITIGVFAVGAIIGLLSFVRILNFVFKKAHDQTIAALTGFMIGSLNKVWPWKQTVETTLNRHGEEIPLIQKNLLPQTFESLTGQPAEFGWALALMIIGVVLVWLLETFGNSNQEG